MQKRALGCYRENTTVRGWSSDNSALNQTWGRYLYLPSTSLLWWGVAGGPAKIQYFPVKPGSSQSWLFMKRATWSGIWAWQSSGWWSQSYLSGLPWQSSERHWAFLSQVWERCLLWRWLNPVAAYVYMAWKLPWEDLASCSGMTLSLVRAGETWGFLPQLKIPEQQRTAKDQGVQFFG